MSRSPSTWRKAAEMLLGIAAGLLFLVPVGGEFAQPAARSAEYALSDDVLGSVERLEDDQFDLGSMVMEISVRAAKDLGVTAMEGQAAAVLISKMSEELRSILKEQRTPAERITAINQYLFAEQRFRVDRSRLFESSLESSLFSLALQNKSGNCLSLSLVYLVLAQRSGLPVHGVIVPGHFFVRYDDGRSLRNIEATGHGENLKDEVYRREYLKGGQDPVSLRNLTRKQVLAVYLSNLANHYKLKGDPRQALAIFAIVERILPDWPSLYTNMGNAQERLGNIDEAVKRYQQALSLDPRLGEAYYNLGLIHFLYTRRMDLAKRYGETARKLGCRFHPEFKAFLDAHR